MIPKLDSPKYKCVAKMVRENHVTIDSHWMHQEIKKNKLAGA